jgi:hypothetical protein
MLFRIAQGRKAREFDPALNALRHMMAEVDTEKSRKVHARLARLEELFGAFEGIMNRFLTSEKSSRMAFEFLKTLTP